MSKRYQKLKINYARFADFFAAFATTFLAVFLAATFFVAINLYVIIFHKYTMPRLKHVGKLDSPVTDTVPP